MRRVTGIMVFWIVLALGAGLCQAGDKGAWKEVLDKKGVVTYSREVPGSKVLEIRAAGVINAPAQVLAEVLRDVPAATEWLPSCIEGCLLEQPDQNHMVMRYVTGLPWPVSDRDLVVRTEVEYDLDHARAISDIRADNGPKYPPLEGMVRITDMESQYVFEYMGPEKTGVIMTTRVDPGGSLPAFFVNIFSKYFAYKQFEALRKMTTLPKYRELAKGSQDDRMIRGTMADRDRVRQIYRNRLAEFIENPEFVDLIVSDDEAFEEIFRNGGDSGPMGEMLLRGWGSRESKKEAVRYLLAQYLEGRGVDKKEVKKMTRDDELIECLLSGQGEDCAGLAGRLTGAPEPAPPAGSCAKQP